ncbi:uncharacterized protein LOC111265066 isoform X2 [Varroa jacobsoni]|uniref:uncharacterized protein LOC111265066 isoform X2 n=1 Tax=Varroa jacobsoni TaxID=62625 RepID=UPI000BF39251|nr:uncharacterized protein LOC111265066 isoform X2 [Varroa jacobsoni]
MTQDLADLSRPQSGAGDASSAIRAPHHNSRNSGNGINRRRSNGDDGGSSSSLQPLTAETDEAPSPNEDQSPTLRQLQQTTQLLSGAGGGQPLPQDVRQQATPNNQGITTRVTSSEDTYVKGDLPREKAVTQPTLKAVPFETGQIIIADPDNVEVMVASAMKQIKLAVTEYLRDTHMELTSRVEALENELERKDSIISELQDELVYKLVPLPC